MDPRRSFTATVTITELYNIVTFPHANNKTRARLESTNQKPLDAETDSRTIIHGLVNYSNKYCLKFIYENYFVLYFNYL